MPESEVSGVRSSCDAVATKRRRAVSWASQPHLHRAHRARQVPDLVAGLVAWRRGVHPVAQDPQRGLPQAAEPARQRRGQDQGEDQGDGEPDERRLQERIADLCDAIDLDVSYSVLAVVLPPVLIVSALPISIAGYGVREASFVVLLGDVGIGSTDATLLSLIGGVAFALASIPGGLLLLQRAPVQPGEVGQSPRRLRPMIENRNDVKKICVPTMTSVAARIVTRSSPRLPEAAGDPVADDHSPYGEPG